jgi:hypothetical protein
MSSKPFRVPPRPGRDLNTIMEEYIYLGHHAWMNDGVLYVTFGTKKEKKEKPKQRKRR